MRELGLRSKLCKKFKVTTNSKHNYLVVENSLNRAFTVKAPSKVWVSDITYIQTKTGFLYLTTSIDLYDRKGIGWSLSDGMSTEQTSLAAWRMAIKNRPIQKGFIFHSDRGVQYAIHKIGGYARYAAFTALGTYIILNPEKAQTQSPGGGGGGFPDPGDGF
jgi:transposase InsO family protein